jgi:hypothetical protein
MHVLRASWRFALGGPALLALLVLGCDPGQIPVTQLALYPECPGHPFEIRYFQITAADDTVAGDTLQSLPNAGAISGIPEYHDCQQLGRHNDRDYGTLAGIFAYEALGTLYAVGGGDPASPRAAAEIVAFEDKYEPLSIELGFNCLYLWQEGADWTARIFSAGGAPSLCSRTLKEWPSTAGHALEVQADRVPGMLDEDYPPVARWEWNPEQGEQFLGIRCGASWCSVRRPGASDRRLPERNKELMPTAPGLTALTAGRWERARLVRGWYDEQRLALEASPGKLVMSEIVGTVLPHPELGSREDAADYAGDWLEVARVVLDQAPGVEQYQSKLGLRVGTNVIEMQQFSTLPPEFGLTTCEPDDDGLFWVARVSSDGARSMRCVERIIHPESARTHAAPGTARWRWDPDDEKTWITCPKGCCTVN